MKAIIWLAALATITTAHPTNSDRPIGPRSAPEPLPPWLERFRKGKDKEDSVPSDAWSRIVKEQEDWDSRPVSNSMKVVKKEGGGYNDIAWQLEGVGNWHAANGARTFLESLRRHCGQVIGYQYQPPANRTSPSGVAAVKFDLVPSVGKYRPTCVADAFMSVSFYVDGLSRKHVLDNFPVPSQYDMLRRDHLEAMLYREWSMPEDERKKEKEMMDEWKNQQDKKRDVTVAVAESSTAEAPYYYSDTYEYASDDDDLSPPEGDSYFDGPGAELPNPYTPAAFKSPMWVPAEEPVEEFTNMAHQDDDPAQLRASPIKSHEVAHPFKAPQGCICIRNEGGFMSLKKETLEWEVLTWGAYIAKDGGMHLKKMLEEASPNGFKIKDFELRVDFRPGNPYPVSRVHFVRKHWLADKVISTTGRFQGGEWLEKAVQKAAGKLGPVYAHCSPKGRIE